MKNFINRWGGRLWPVVESHDDAKCFSCHGKLYGHPYDSGFPDGNGRWRQKCAKCDMTTWYDVEGGQR